MIVYNCFFGKNVNYTLRAVVQLQIGTYIDSMS